MRRSFARVVAALGVLLAMCGGGGAWGQAAEPARLGAAEHAALRTLARTRIQELAEKRAVRPVDPVALAAEARRIADRLSGAQLRALAAGEDVEETITPSLMTAASLGDATTHLTFVPLTPCRIIDTRQAGGKLLPGVDRDFQVSGATEFGPQGGKIGGCGVPSSSLEPIAAAVMINFVAVQPNGPGNLRSWAYGEPVPLASIINYDQLPGFFNVANGLIVPIAGTESVPADLSVRADTNGTHLVADVTGYFTRFPIEGFQATEKSITEVVNGGTVDLSAGACTEVSSCTLVASAPGQAVIRAWAQIQLNHGTNVGGDRIAVGVKNMDPTNCTNNDQSINATDYEVPDSLPAETDVDWTLSHKRIFVQPTGPKTYYINARMITGASSGDVIQSTRLICTFIPD